jgi:hypothetical protein
VAEDFDEIYRGMIQLLKFQDQTNERLDWLQGLVAYSLERKARAMGIEV